MLNLVIAVLVNNFIDNAQQQGLLKTQNFVDVLRMVVTMRVRADVCEFFMCVQSCIHGKGLHVLHAPPPVFACTPSSKSS